MRINITHIAILVLAFFASQCIALLGSEPTNAAELAKEKSAEVVSNQSDEARKAKMSKEELAWEKVLEENLGSFYLPAYKKAKAEGKETAWDYVKDDPKLPRVLIIGDSISRGYTQTVRKNLKGVANVHRAPANCGPTKVGLKKLDVWLGNSQWDLITFNFGIHNRSTDNKTYADNLNKIVSRLKKTGAKIVWVNSTPVPAGSNEYVKGASERCNTTAAEIMKAEKIPTIDLYKQISPVLEKYQLPKNCHFNEEGYVFLGGLVSAAIKRELAAPN